MQSQPVEHYASQARDYLKSALQPNFYRLHLCYFILVILVTSAIFWGSNTADFHVSYTDSLFLCCSAMCNVGLNTVNLGSINGFQQSVLFVTMLLGDLSLVSISVVVVRRYFFSKYMKDFVQHSRTGRRIAEDIEHQDSSRSYASARSDSPVLARNRRQNLSSQNQSKSSRAQESSGTKHEHHISGYGGFPTPWHSTYWLPIFDTMHKKVGGGKTPEHPYLTFQPSLDHKGRFHSLTPKQEAEVGGVEYRALKLLTWLLPTYTLFWIFLIIVVMTPYVSYTNAGNVIRTAQPGNLNPAWWSVFTSVSAYTNCGLNLLNENMIPLSNDYLILIFTGMIILTGNTLYPFFLRVTIWTLSKLVPENSEIHHTLLFLLHHPRRCYLFLFPAKNTFILLLAQTAINLTAWVFFIILNINYTPIDPLIPPGLRVFQGLYQAHGLRASGFYITLISDVAPALQFFYMVAMYISAYPIIMSIRTSNVYEERSIGQEDENKSQSALHDPKQQQKAGSKLGEHIQKQLAYDLWWIILCVWIVSIIERSKLAPSPPADITPPQPTSLPSPAPGFSNGLFSILFETISAYGTVGLSLGVPYNNYSFCGAWQALSKLVLMTVMLRGRHRILPMAIDRAILLPGQDIMERLDKRFRGGSDNEGDWERNREEIREEERGSDVEHEQDEGRNGKQMRSSEEQRRDENESSAARKGNDEDEDGRS